MIVEAILSRKCLSVEAHFPEYYILPGPILYKSPFGWVTEGEDQAILLPWEFHYSPRKSNTTRAVITLNSNQPLSPHSIYTIGHPGFGTTKRQALLIITIFLTNNV